jgi:hypothetical protein
VSDVIPDVVVNVYTDITSGITSDFVSYIVYDISRAGLVPPLDKETAGIITGSEAILKEFASKHSLNARTINAVIKDELKIQLSMRMKLIPTYCSDCKPGDVQINNINAKGDGAHVLKSFKRPVEKVLRELMADMRLAGSQHFAFHEYKDPRGNRLLQGTTMVQYLFN